MRQASMHGLAGWQGCGTVERYDCREIVPSLLSCLQPILCKPRKLLPTSIEGWLQGEGLTVPISSIKSWYFVVRAIMHNIRWDGYLQRELTSSALCSHVVPDGGKPGGARFCNCSNN